MNWYQVHMSSDMCEYGTFFFSQKLIQKKILGVICIIRFPVNLFCIFSTLKSLPPLNDLNERRIYSLGLTAKFKGLLQKI